MEIAIGKRTRFNINPVWIVLIAALVVAVAGNLPALLEQKYADIRDWSLFNGISLFTRSTIVHFKTLLFYDPWTCGGTDVYANPQSRLFSPMMLLDILFPPQLANIMSLIIYGMIGFVGCHYLFRHFRVSFWIGLVCSTIFINSHWFGLHFAEGHIVYGTFLLIPWVLLAIININERAYLLLFTMLCALFILDGSFYTFIFSFVLLVACFIFGIADYKKIFCVRFFADNWRFLILLVLFFSCIASFKIIPLMTHDPDRPAYEPLFLPLKDFPLLFLEPRGTPLDVVETAHWFLQEYGCYIGYAVLCTVGIYLAKRKNRDKKLKFVFISLFFLWIGTGWGGAFNPYTIIDMIPFANIAHIQARYFLFMHLFIVILLAFALQKMKVMRARYLPLLVFLIAESFFVRMHPVYRMFETGRLEKKEQLTQSIITSTTIERTIFDGHKPFHYFTNQGCQISHEPMAAPTSVLNYTEADYRGEVYFEDPGVKGFAVYQRVTPGRVEFAYNLFTGSAPPAVIVLNLNYLAGWRVVSGPASIASVNKRDLIKLTVKEQNGEVVIEYAPWYLGTIFTLYIIGLAFGAFAVVVYLRKGKPFFARPTAEQPPAHGAT